MPIHYRILVAGTAVLGGAIAAPTSAQTLNLSITIPRMSVAEYHAPYVAVYLEKQGAPPRTLSIWYDYDNRENKGTKWLADMRQWWRAAGRTMSMPADGITGATRAPGPQKIAFVAGKGPLGALTPGQYILVVEAAREVGGREVVRLPFAWPPKAGQVVNAAGASELGAVSLGFGK